MNQLNLRDGYIEFCPDVGDECIGPTCAAFARGIHMSTNASLVLLKLGYSAKVANTDGTFTETPEEPFPLDMELDIFHCGKYEKIIGRESADVYFPLMYEFNGIDEILEKIAKAKDNDEDNECSCKSCNKAE